MTPPDLARRSLLLLAVLTPGLAISPTANAQASRGDESPPADLAQALAAYHRATIGSDVAALGRIVADDYLLVNSDSSIQDKPSYLADFRVPGFRLDPYVVEEPFHRVWGDAALTGGSMRLAWVLNSRRESRRLRFVHAWRREHGRWRIAYSQLTRIPDGRAAQG